MTNRHDFALHRRNFLKTATAATAGVAAAASFQRISAAADAPQPIDIGSRRELFLEDTLIDRLEGRAELRLHHPVPQEIVLTHDAPWEGSGSGYHSVFQDGPLYRMYYKAWHLDVSPKGVNTGRHPLYCCYAESDDGIQWRKPELGLYEFQGSKANNITLASGMLGQMSVDAGHPAVFKDENPAAPSDSRYKALVRSNKARGLLAFQSADGLRWSPMVETPVITEGAFDSQNLAFWDPTLGKYRAYWRVFTGIGGGKSVRAIRTATSDDFAHWSKWQDISYTDSPHEELYTNQIKPYYRAPHLLIGFPTRYVERKWDDSLKALPEREQREMRSKTSERYGTAITEGLVMASRDGLKFKRWNEAFLRPGIERPGTWNYGQQYLGWHVVETKSPLEGAPPELSLYASESYWTGDSSTVRRYTLRLDGFVSAKAPRSGGKLVTKPVNFSGNELRLNFATSAAGGVRVELQDAAGQPIPGFTLGDCQELYGDSIERKVTWKEGAAVSKLAGQPVRLRFSLKDADVYAFQFAEA